MADRIDQIHRNILKNERGFSVDNKEGALLGAVYPNTYHVAMSNLAFQWLFFALNQQDDFFAERIVLPDGKWAEAYQNSRAALATIDSSLPARNCLAWFVTLPFENDYPNLVHLCKMAGFAPRFFERTDNDPMIVVGGTGPMLNPEPIAPFIDVALLGEGDAVLAPFLERLSDYDSFPDRNAFLESLSDLPFAYVPSPNKPGTKSRLKIRREKSIDSAPTHTHVLTADTEFKNMFLTETFRGCSGRCRFCAAGHLMLPPRERDPKELDSFPIDSLMPESIGLVGAGVSGHSKISDWLAGASAKARVGISSLRFGTLSVADLGILADGGAKSIAIAPEAGSERLRRVCNKPYSNEQIVQEAARVINSGAMNLKLYFMIGLPTETPKDLDAICALVGDIKDAVMPIWKKRGRAGTITASVNPFIPKAHTPFQWAAFITKKRYQAARKMLTAQLAGLGNVRLQFESYRSAWLQAVLSMGDRNTAEIIERIAQGEALAQVLRSANEILPYDIFANREKDRQLPWDIIDMGIDKDRLIKQYDRALAEKVSPACNPPACKSCDLCRELSLLP